MARPILVANWKNHPGSIKEAASLSKEMSKSRALYKKLSLFVAPPYPYFDSVSSVVKSFASLASQDIVALPKGSHTGFVTADILKSFGVKLSIIGHSERRALGETSQDVALKIKESLRAGIAPLVCVGEKDRDVDGEHFEFLREELRSSFAGLSRRADISKLAVAYEPVWAIGGDAQDAMEAGDLSQSVIFIRKVLTEIFGRALAENIPILYGGSVEPDNVGALLSETGVRGFLVGHASLDGKTFKAVAESLTGK